MIPTINASQSLAKTKLAEDGLTEAKRLLGEAGR